MLIRMLLQFSYVNSLNKTCRSYFILPLLLIPFILFSYRSLNVASEASSVACSLVFQSGTNISSSPSFVQAANTLYKGHVYL